MNNQGNFKLNVAAPNPSKFNFDKKVVATQDFGTMTPIECKFMAPGDTFDVKVNQFTYLMPMPKPTFGRIDTINRGFFVPFRVLMKDWKEFISNQPVPSIVGTQVSTHAAVVPKTTIDQFSYAFASLCSRDAIFSAGQLGRLDTVDSPEVYDYIFSVDGDDDYLTLSFIGRKFMSVLHGLGYNFPFIYENTGIQNADLKANSQKEISLLPLLSFARAYFDWVIPSRFIPQHRTLQVALNSIFDGHTTIGSSGSYDDGSGIVKAPLLIGLFKLYSSYLDDDFFTSAFISQYGYESDVASSTLVPNFEYQGSFKFDEVGAPYTGQAGANVATSMADYPNMGINQFTLKSLGALQDMINRGKVAGNKIQDYLKVTYGIEPSSEALDLSTYLGSSRHTIKIGPVMSNADTAAQGGATLGQFAGRGLTNDLEDYGHFHYEAKEHGIFIITNELQVRSSYWQGLRPECELLNREDFLLPELDNLGVEAIKKYQLVYNDLIGSYADSGFIDYLSIFGFTPTYSKFKVNFDSLIGDFRFKSKNTGLDSWYLMRYFGMGDRLQIDENFALMTQRNTSTQYDHIFQVADNSADHFYSVFNLDFTAIRHLKPISEALETEEGSRPIDVKFNGGVN